MNHPSFSSSSSSLALAVLCEARFECGNISIGYPFFGGHRLPQCGHPGLELQCHHSNTTTFEMVGVRPFSDQRFRNDYECGSWACSSSPGYTNATLFYDCPPSSSSSLGFFPCNSSSYNNVSVTTGNIRLDGCLASLTFPIFQAYWTGFSGNPSLPLVLGVAMKTGFQVKWKEDTSACLKCNASGGACGFNISDGQTFCYCPH
ncbi:hypothetical protein F3Y22_tig00117034pilonHSYRG00348 [Hibiscus syriacus]|uniref:non-specific serine/threonine protein kinase n=1 Tax=Hibiscus syriacus TaxID=106335 RepID=A0A6A2XM38_HIBSY|nr:hypothetical protein F3Y22_tig00117034pilonHSYRG00348 [Hibiscus syriacus]